MENKEIINQEYSILLKNKQKRTTILFFVRLFIVVLIFILMGGYLLSPLSSLKMMSLEGNIYFSKSDILSLIHHDEDDSLYSVNEKLAVDLLNEHPLIENAEIVLTPFSFNVIISECAPVAKYQDVIYHTEGTSFSEEEFENEIINEYLTKHNIFFSEYLSSPSEVSVEYNAELLKFVAFSNKYEPMVHYLDIDKNEKTFIFYYRLSDNAPYIRVNFNKSSDITSDVYASLISNDAINELLHLLENRSITTKTKNIGDEVISYYDTDLTIENENGQFSAHFDYR